jgi:hypothetical protein
VQIDWLMRMKDPGAQELESSAPIHGALDHLQLADLTFDRAKREFG